MDAGQTQEARTEFLTSAGNFLNNALPVMQSSPDLTPLMGEMMLCSPCAATVRAGRSNPLSRKLCKISRNGSSNSSKPSSRDRLPTQQPRPRPLRFSSRRRLREPRVRRRLQSLQQKGQIEAQKGEMEAQKGQLELAQEQAELQGMVQKQALELEKLKAQIKAVGQRQTVQ